MPAVSLREVVEGLDLQSDELHACLDLTSGEIVVFSLEMAHIAESEHWERAPEWMKESLPQVKRALEGDHMLDLPDRAHIDEWRMMQDFAEAEPQCRCRNELSAAARGKGAFRSFRDAVRRLGLEQAWYDYREAAYLRVAREWLEENGIRYRD